MLPFIYFFFLLLILLYVFVLYAGIPAVLLWGFFRSDWVPRSFKNIGGAVLGVLVCLGGGYLYLAGRTRHEAADRPHFPPVRLTATQPGLLPYPLGRGSIEQARYDTVRLLVITGDLPGGSLLRARLTAGPGFASPNKTNVVAVTTDDGNATQATGRSVYEPNTRTVRGTFRCVLPSGKRLSVSFPPTPVVLPGATP